MKKWILILTALLAVQVILILTVHLSGEKYQAFQATERLFPFDLKAVDDIRIDDGTNKVVMVKLGGGWVLPDMDDFPADAGNINKLLTKLAFMVKGWPVATTSGAATRFKVADNDFERKLTVQANGKVAAELYVGTSPGFRKVHIRPAGSDTIYAVVFNAWEAPAEMDSWIDKKRLAFELEEIVSIQMPGFFLKQDFSRLRIPERIEGEMATRPGDKPRTDWVLSDLGEKERLDQDKAREFLTKLAEMPIQTVLGKEAKPEYLQDQPALEITVKRKGGAPLVYVFSKPEGENYYVVKRSDLGEYYKVAELSVKPLLEASRDDLIRTLSDEELAEEQAAMETGESEGTEPAENPAPVEEAPAEQSAETAS